jgi:hypothetical protein
MNRPMALSQSGDKLKGAPIKSAAGATGVYLSAPSGSATTTSRIPGSIPTQTHRAHQRSETSRARPARLEAPLLRSQAAPDAPVLHVVACSLTGVVCGLAGYLSAARRGTVTAYSRAVGCCLASSGHRQRRRRWRARFRYGKRLGAWRADSRRHRPMAWCCSALRKFWRMFIRGCSFKAPFGTIRGLRRRIPSWK